MNAPAHRSITAKRAGLQYWMLPAGVLVALLASVFVHAGSGSFEVQEVAPGNFVHLGKHASIESAERDDIANIGFIVGEKCVAVIDTGGSVKVGEALQAAVKEQTQVPICYVINTHVHFDHVLGNVAFSDGSAEFIGHAKLPGAILGNRKFFMEQFAAELGDHANEAGIIAPAKTVTETLELDLGGKTLLLHAYPKAHTAADLTVLDRSTGTLWAGDLLFRTRVPSLDGSITGWLDVIGRMEQQQDIELVVPGHGPIASDLAGAFADEKRYLEVIADETRASIAAGDPLEEAMDKVGASEHDHWELFDDAHKRNVSRAFAELEWE